MEMTSVNINVHWMLWTESTHAWTLTELQPDVSLKEYFFLLF